MASEKSEISLTCVGSLMPKPTPIGKSVFSLTLLIIFSINLLSGAFVPVIPAIETKYRNPELIFIISFNLSSLVVGVIIFIISIPNF